MALARQNQRDQGANAGGLAGRANFVPYPLPLPPRARQTAYACPAAQASRSWRFITLPLALRGSGSDVSAIVSGTL
jgi:hypothetical protein